MSIKSQKSQGVKAGKLVVVTTRKETSRLLTKKKLEKLKELCFEISKAKNYFSKKYNTLSGMALIKNYRKTVRDELVKTKKPFPFKSKLQARQWKTCLDEVFFNISSRYALIIDELKKNPGKAYPAGYLFVTMGAGDNWKIGRTVCDELNGAEK